MSKNDRLLIKEKSDVSTIKRKNDFSPDWKSGNTVSNDASMFGNHEIGTSKEIVLFVSKKDFLSRYFDAIKEIFDLTDTQVRIMTGLLTSASCRDMIYWDTEAIQSLSNKIGLSVVTIQRFFPALHLHKKLLIKIKNGQYQINKAILFHAEELTNLNLAKLTFSFKFQSEEQTLKTMTERAVEISRELQDIYNQHLRDAQSKNV